MIGAILTNTPAIVLKGSGVAAERDPGSGEVAQGRAGESARDSLASPRAAAIRSDGAVPLTPEAVLALQESEDPTGADGRKPLPGATDDEETAGSANAANPGAEEEDATGESGAAPGLQDPAEETVSDEEDADGDGLNEAEEQQVDKLKQRDREVRAHEQAHATVGGAYASAPSYTYQQGPDGKRYAIGGEVQIDTSRERTPEATIRKMQVVIRAATAPADPSSQDMRVAQQAQAQLAEAQAELRQQKTEELSGGEDEDPGQLGESDRGEDDAGSSETAQAGGGRDEASAAGRRERADAASAYQAAVERAAGSISVAGSLIA
ncbi:putative metalloprotease CJM1_0395 family protein [Roseibium sp. M-1]